MEVLVQFEQLFEGFGLGFLDELGDGFERLVESLLALGVIEVRFHFSKQRRRGYFISTFVGAETSVLGIVISQERG